jgi:UDP-N-acetylmuramoylalanine--D-glutamate ligase
MLLIYWKWKVGSAVAKLCEWRGIDYEICDDSDAPASYDDYDTIVPSPWVSASHSVYNSGKVKSELDFASEVLPRDFVSIAVTGTDGKSTTSWILYQLLLSEFGEKHVSLSGNFDIPFSQTVREILERW